MHWGEKYYPDPRGSDYVLHHTACGHDFIPERYQRVAKHFHGLMSWTMGSLPDFMVAKIIMDMHLAIRSKGIKKDKRLAEEAKGKKD